jgi:hypothetical protein
MKNSGKRGIRRYEYDGVFGWQVRYFREGAQFQKIFSDKAHGGEASALAAAEAFHAQLVSYFPPALRREHMDRRRANSKEVVGVSRVMKKVTSRSKHYEYPAWQARWTTKDGKHANKSFYVSTHGEEGARLLAEELRRAKLAEHGDESSADYTDEFVWIVAPEEISIAANLDLESDAEGALALREHRSRERSRELRASKIEAFRAAHGSIFCEICGFDFERSYGALGSGLIEVHHTKAIADYQEGDVTVLADLILVCSNCHYVIHRDWNYERNYRQIREVVALQKSLQPSSRQKKRANQSLEPTTLLGTSAAEQPLVPSRVVAHL